MGKPDAKTNQEDASLDQALEEAKGFRLNRGQDNATAGQLQAYNKAVGTIADGGAVTTPKELGQNLRAASEEHGNVHPFSVPNQGFFADATEGQEAAAARRGEHALWELKTRGLGVTHPKTQLDENPTWENPEETGAG